MGGAVLRRRMADAVRRIGFTAARVGKRLVFSAHDPARSSDARSGAAARYQPATSSIHVGVSSRMVAANWKRWESGGSADDMANAHDPVRRLARARDRALDLAHSIFVRICLAQRMGAHGSASFIFPVGVAVLVGTDPWTARSDGLWRRGPLRVHDVGS